APRGLAGYRQWRAVLRLGTRELRHWADPARGWGQVIGDVDAWMTANRQRLLDELLGFIRAPSVSTDPAYAGGIDEAAGILAARLRRIGLDDVQLLDGGGHKAVYGAWTRAPGAPTLVVYGHYDVQPPDPLDLWETPPFEPTIRDGCIHARGAS